MENTRQIKEGFFAQYWGLDVVKLYNTSTKEWDKTLNADTIHFCDFIILKNVQLITKDELNELKELFFKDKMHTDGSATYSESLMVNEFGDFVIEVSDYYYTSDNILVFSNPLPFETTLNLIDHLRSKGYLLPFNDLSKDDILNYGWVKYEI